MDVPFNISGSKIILGLYTISRKMVAFAFAFPVFFLQQSAYHGSDPGVLVSCPMTKFKKALELIRNHADMGHHKRSCC